ncbi:MAG: outer membrane protein assembly factor BamE [Candidatus Omnitrophica bacterium]|nr:outer membrane protein assembly factor BamE [Candidatus Omnitrophota bacterium]
MTKYKNVLKIFLIFFLVFTQIQTSLYARTKRNTGDSKEQKKPKEKKVKYVKSKYALGALMALDASRKKMTKEYNEETKSYNDLAELIDVGEIKIGLTEDEVLKLVGEPVIVIDTDNFIEWYYKPGTKTFMDNQKIILSFDSSGKLEKFQNILSAKS